MKKIGDRTAIVTLKELGTNCWLTRRFIRGTRCERLDLCKYPERKTCQAAYAEIDHLKNTKERHRQCIVNIENRIFDIAAGLEK